jgi:hypothetical protein
MVGSGWYEQSASRPILSAPTQPKLLIFILGTGSSTHKAHFDEVLFSNLRKK